MTTPNFRISIYADGADVREMVAARDGGIVKGFTTNPTLMRKVGITDYAAFAKEALASTGDMPISFEVFADEAGEMRRQAERIATWADNVYVKIPVSNTNGDSMAALAGALSGAGIKVNITALFTPRQVTEITQSVAEGAPSFLSVFAGRIADAGVDPVPLMQEALEIMGAAPRAELIWASPRELLNLVQADAIGCHIITMTHDLLAKLPTLGKDLEAFSLETVRMFHRDATQAGFEL